MENIILKYCRMGLNYVGFNLNNNNVVPIVKGWMLIY